MNSQPVTAGQFHEEPGDVLELRLIAGEVYLDRIPCKPAVSRPSLALSRFARYFASKRRLIVDSAEFLANVPSAQEIYLGPEFNL
jgi:hypothetical protein